MRATLDHERFRAAVRKRIAPTEEKLQRIADFAKGQIDERFRTAGASGGTPWAPTITPLGHKPPLAGLENSYTARVVNDEAQVVSYDFRTRQHHLGTVGKGGILPDIVPVKAKALYIPLTEVGKMAHEAMKSLSPVVRTVWAGVSSIDMPKADKARFVGIPHAVYGVDFLLLKRVAMPPRPQLPTSDQERADLKAFVMKTLENP